MQKARQSLINFQPIRCFFDNYNIGTCQNLIRKVGKVSSARQSVPESIFKPPYYEKWSKPEQDNFIEIKNEEQIQGMRNAGKLAANILKSCGSIAKVSHFFNNSKNFIHKFHL